MVYIVTKVHQGAQQYLSCQIFSIKMDFNIQSSNICVVECDSRYHKVTILLRGSKLHG
jgi:hypothetical protein